jgi:two-component sensor histidine kinase
MTQWAQGSYSDVQVLLHELDHRINNEFAFPIGIVSLAAARTKNDEGKDALSGFFHIFSIAPFRLRGETLIRSSI